MPTGDLGNWLAFISNFGIGGVLVWYLYHTTSVLVPRLHDTHQSAIREIVAEFRSDLKEERTLRMKMHEDLMEMHQDLRALLARLAMRPCLLDDQETKA
jgi:hypothetical protein